MTTPNTPASIKALLDNGWVPGAVMPEGKRLWSIDKCPEGLRSTVPFRNLTEEDALKIQKCFDLLIAKKASS